MFLKMKTFLNTKKILFIVVCFCICIFIFIFEIIFIIIFLSQDYPVSWITLKFYTNLEMFFHFLKICWNELKIFFHYLFYIIKEFLRRVAER